MTGLQEKSRKGMMDGLRSFTEMDNGSALEVGHMRKGLWLCMVQRAKFSEDCAEVLREGGDDFDIES